MSAASKKALVAASVAALALLALASGASGGWGAQFAERVRDRQPPTAPGNLRVTAASAKSLSLAWDRSTDNVGVRGYYVYVNGRRSTVSSTAYTAGRLNCGQSVAVAVVAFDRAGNRSPRAETITSTAACPDTRPPTPPTGISQAATAGDAVVLVWNPANDDVGVVGYGVYSGGLLVASSPEPAVTLSGLTCASTYAYEIDAVDAAGNRSSRTPYWAVTADCADVEPPSKPTDLTLVDSTRSSLSLEWSPSSDNVGVAGYRLAVTGPPGASSVSTRTVGQPSATVTGLACGTKYDVDVEAYDSAGNSSLPATVSASTDDCVDSTPPTTPTGLRVVGSTRTTVSLAWGASTDNVGVQGYGVYVNGTSAPPVGQLGTTVSGLECGTSYAFGVDAYDAVGNHSGMVTVSAATAACPTPPPPPSDTTSPTQPGNLAVAGATRSSIALTWSPSTDNVGVTGYVVYRNGTPLPAVTQPGMTVSGLQCGTAYTLEVDAVDAATNRSSRAAVTASTAACPDTQAPTAPTNLTATSRTTTSIALSWSTSTDAVGVVGYGLYLGGQPVGTANGTTGIFSDLTCNTGYTLSVDAYDAAGNHSAKTTVMVATTACPPPPVPTVTMGESSVLSLNDYGNGNLLVSQKATLARAGILRRMSFYVTTASGNLRMAVYAANGSSGGPGTKLAETSSFTPTAGWNTVDVLAPVTLGAGNYWLAYLPSSSTLAFRVGSGGEARWTNYSYGPAPATFPASGTTESVRWSLYATLDVTNEVPPPLPPPPPPAAQCADGADNDGDGAVDLNDPGCTSTADNDETNLTPSPPPGPAPTPAPPPPPSGGYPNASNTGPTGPLTSVSGNLTVTTPGTVIQNQNRNGCVFVRAANVTIRNSRISCGGWVIDTVHASAVGLLVEDTILECGHRPGDAGITNKDYTLRRVEIFGCENNAWCDRNCLIEDSYIHDPVPYDPVTDPHTDSIQIRAGSSNITIRHNTVYGGYISQQNFGNSAITTGSGVSNFLVDNNLLAGGGATLRCEGTGTNTNYRILNNRFSRVFVSTVGGFFPVNGCHPAFGAGSDWATITEFSGNVYHETGQPLP